MADVQEAGLYDRDFYAWALDQARAVRELRDAVVEQGEAEQGNVAPVFQAVDWDNLIEELEGLAGRDRRELRSRIITTVQHLLKLELSTAVAPRESWMETVQRSRAEITLLLQDSLSLRQQVESFLGSPILLKAAKETIETLKRMDEIQITRLVAARLSEAGPYTEAQILEDWWPDPGETNP